jgi:serine/threonine-protein kinase HipA
MLDAVEVKIWGQSVGALIWNATQEYSVFRFNTDFLKLDLDLAPLLMPLSGIDPRTTYSFQPNNIEDKTVYKGLPPFIADSLPDSFGNKVIDEWLNRQGRSPGSFTPLERLCYTGERGLGALEFYPPETKVEIITDIDIQNLVQLAQEVFASRLHFSTHRNKGVEAMKDLISVGVSAGGARPKAVIACNDAIGEIKSGQLATVPQGFQHWLIKLDGVTKSSELGLATGMGRVEYAYYLMAKDCGIMMNECRLLEEGGRAHFMTRRFDRPGNGEKLHLQSLHAIAGMNYSIKRAFSYEQVFSVIRQLNLPYSAIEQVFRRMIFNVIAKNCDDHTKNLSFMMNQQGEWSLAPAYDVSYAYDPTGKWNQDHFLSINGKYDHFEYADMEKVAKEQRIKNFHGIISQICEVAGRWESYANLVEVPKKIRNSIAKVHKECSIARTSSVIKF